MKNINKIQIKILRYQETIKKLRSDKTLDNNKRKRAIFILQRLIKELKWVIA